MPSGIDRALMASAKVLSGLFDFFPTGFVRDQAIDESAHRFPFSSTTAPSRLHSVPLRASGSAFLPSKARKSSRTFPSHPLPAITHVSPPLP